MKTRENYLALIAALDDAEERLEDLLPGIYFTDMAQDDQNTQEAGLTKESDGYWDLMYKNAEMFAEQKASENGLSISKVLAKARKL